MQGMITESKTCFNVHTDTWILLQDTLIKNVSLSFKGKWHEYGYYIQDFLFLL